ncbi:MAG TPA: alcohol dehydrogenase catalytic domain-containing protein [Archangium sp.]|jgi:threonine dehydrogenase-like Zn-dependent dehydrogenase|uniref:alcohol dehydrogenase catalytic domain-containing protein n=1 Tax=Archangium sp. TaxID=1872627 RepID=UPI002ED9E02E
MRAGFYEGPGRFQITDVPEPKLQAPDDVIVEVEVAGMCGTDLHIVSVPQMHPAKEGIVLGHEFVGRVVETGKGVRGLAVGDRVIAGPNIWCGQCDACRRGRRKMCQHNEAMGISRDGGFARYVRAPARVLYPVPEGLSSELAVFAEPMSCILNGLQRIGPCHGASVAVLGAGPIGLYFTRLFRHFGADRVYVSEPMAHRREAALRSGADQVVDPKATPVVEAFLSETKGGADIVVDTAGFLLPDALAATRPGGTVLVFGMDTTCTCTIRPFDIVRQEKSIVGCFIDNDTIPKCLDLIPHLRMGELISHRFGLEDIGQAFGVLERAEAIKALVMPGSSSAA